MADYIDAGKLNQPVQVLELRETAPGVWEWTPVRRTWASITFQSKTNLFSKVGIGARDAAVIVRRQALIEMLTTNTLMNAVEAALKRLYPGEPVYYDELPKDFRRPSFTLECQKAEQSDVNIGLVRRSVTLLVTCYVEADAYHDSSRKALNQRQDTVMGLFAQGFFQVEDRALTVQANRGLGNPDFAEVSAVFQWMDARPGYQDPEAADTPKMEHFAIERTAL